MEPCRNRLQTCMTCPEPCAKLFLSFLQCMVPEAIQLPFCSLLDTEQYFFTLREGAFREKCGVVKKDGEKCMSAWRLPSYINAICCGAKLNEGFPGGKAANPKLGRAGFQHLLSHKLAAWPCTSNSRPTCIMVLTYLVPGRKSSTLSWLNAED